MTINILGAQYTITVKKYDEDEMFERCDCAGYCTGVTKSIVLCDMSTYKGWEHESLEAVKAYEKKNLRHEIVHAFFEESGLSDNSSTIEGWARNEEMVDWIAIQGPKIWKAWQEAGAV